MISASGGVTNRSSNPYTRAGVATQIMPARRQFISSEAPVTCHMSDPYSRMGRLRTGYALEPTYSPDWFVDRLSMVMHIQLFDRDPVMLA